MVFLTRLCSRRPSVQCWPRLCQRYLSSDLTQTHDVIRLANPVRVSRDSWVDNLCASLHSSMPSKYPFLAKNLDYVEETLKFKEVDKDMSELINTLKDMPVMSPELEDKCLNLFESWVGKKTKLSLAYLMYANRDQFHSNEFLTKVCLFVYNV
jgi:hypothetical protein